MPYKASANHQASASKTLMSPVTSGAKTPSLSALEEAILQTVAYVDMYDYPLTAAEIHRYLVGIPAELPEVERALEKRNLVNHLLGKNGEYYFLAGRGHIVDVRRRRARISEQLWPHAIYYGRLASALPFVSMVAVTGSLAVDNVDSQADIDYLIVTEPGRLWLCRAMVILLVRRAARRGITLCPNYFLSETALSFEERNLFAAHEIVQMIPITGLKVYHQLLEENQWVSNILPNSSGAPRPISELAKPLPAPVKGARRLGEFTLRTPPGGWLERWEMNRKVRRFSQQPALETAFSVDYCKGHFEDHGRRTLDQYTERLEKLTTQDEE
jgi:hypothetical protein